MVGVNVSRVVFGFLFIVFTCCFPAYSQRTVLDFDHLDHIPELSNRSATAITQDKKGFIWIGTSDGLIRYDGHQAKVFKQDPDNDHALSDNNIRALAVDSVGNLWIATQGGGLNHLILNQEKFLHYKNDPNDPASISGNAIWSLLIDARGFVWAGTWSNGLNRLNISTGKFERYAEKSTDPVLAIFEDRQGDIWYSANGLNRLNLATQETRSYTHSPQDSTSLSSHNIRAISQDAVGNIWVATDNAGINKLTAQTSRFQRYFQSKEGLSSNDIYDILIDRDGLLWLATSNGLNLWDPQSSKAQVFKHDPTDPLSLSNNNPRVLFKDNSGSVWIGNEGGRINKTLDKKAFDLYDIEAGLSNNLIRSIYEDRDGKIWIGTQGGGLNILNPTNGSIRQVSQDSTESVYVSSSQVSSILQDENGKYWIGTWGDGIFLLDYENQEVMRYMHEPGNNSVSDNRIQLFYIDKFGVFWVGTESGLNIFDPASQRWTLFEGLNGNTIQGQAFVEDADGTLWVGTWNGLNRINPARNEVQSWREDKNALSNEHVISLCKQQDVLWIGTFGGGLFKMVSGTGEFVNYTEREGLPNNVIFGIRPDSAGNLWLSTNNGLSRFAPSQEIFRNYDQSEGLQGNEFYWGAAGSTVGGQLMFGGVNGLTIFSPGDIKDNTFVPPVVISDFQIYNKLISVGKDSVLERSIVYTADLSLSYKDAVLTFDFAALNYNHPEKNQYAYMLEGFEEEWNYVGNRNTATYTNLDPGDYVFRVKGSNNDNIWNDKGVSLNISISPPFWKTWWFYLICLASVSTAVYSVVQFRERKLKQDKKVLKDAIKKAQKEVEDQKRAMERQRESEKERVWTDQGLVQFGEVLSRSKDDIDELCKNILRSLISYLDVNLAAIYLTDTTETDRSVLRVRASYGYDNQRREFSPGEGLVGECYRNNEVGYFDNLPNGYLTVSSSLGESSASYVLVVPLTYEDVTLGVIEIGSFRPIESVKQNLVVTFSLRLTTAINTTMLSARTKKLLEDSNLKAEELAVREEELRQNLEEMQAMNEDRDRKSKEMEETIKNLKKQINQLRKSG